MNDNDHAGGNTDAPRPKTTWDAFISYSHADLASAVRIQAFIEDYALPGSRKLCVFRDKTDLRGGRLAQNLPTEIRAARLLLVCCSKSAAESEWVELEIRAFDEAHGHNGKIVPLLLSGSREESVPPVLEGRETLELDLREGWRFGRPRNSARIELLRAIATVADIPLRDLIPWDSVRRRRRRLTLAGAGLTALAAVGFASADAWLTGRDADAAALRRDAEMAELKLDAGDVPGGLAALGKALANDTRGLLQSRVDVFRHWLAVLPPARETADAADALVRVNRQTWLRTGPDRFNRFDVRDPYIAVKNARGDIVAAGPNEIVLFSGQTANALSRVKLRPGSQVASIRTSRDGHAVVVLVTMTGVSNDEDEPDYIVPCTALFLEAPVADSGAPSGNPPRNVRLETSQSAPRLLQMQPAGAGTLHWHDCTDDKFSSMSTTPTSDAPEADVPARDIWASEASAPLVDKAALAAAVPVSLDVPRLPRNAEIVRAASSGFDAEMAAAWPEARRLTVMKLPGVTAEAALWRDAGEERPGEGIPHRVGIVQGMSNADFEALGTNDVPDNSEIASEALILAGLPYDQGRIFWGMYVSGNSYVSTARCVAPAQGKVTACAHGVEFIGLRANTEASPDGRWLAVSSQHGAAPPLMVYDALRNAEREPDKEPLAPVNDIAFTADSSRLAVLTIAGELSSYHLEPGGALRYERSVGTHYGDARDACWGQHALKAVRGAIVAAVTPDCALQVVDLSTGVLLWRTTLNAPAAAAPGDTKETGEKEENPESAEPAEQSDTLVDARWPNPQLAMSTDGDRLLVHANGLATLFQTYTGARLSASFDPRTLKGQNTAATVSESSDRLHETGPALAQDGTLDIFLDGRAWRRASPPDRSAALAALPALDRRTLISTEDGRTPLDTLP